MRSRSENEGPRLASSSELTIDDEMSQNELINPRQTSSGGVVQDPDGDCSQEARRGEEDDLRNCQREERGTHWKGSHLQDYQSVHGDDENDDDSAGDEADEYGDAVDNDDVD